MIDELHVDHLFLRLDEPGFEIQSDESSYQQRIHVDVARDAGPAPW